MKCRIASRHSTEKCPSEQCKKLKCFNCRGLGHIAAECPSDAMFCKEKNLVKKSRSGRC